jgi:hypothetical protein
MKDGGLCRQAAPMDAGNLTEKECEPCVGPGMFGDLAGQTQGSR